jgi:hypothetical protein
MKKIYAATLLVAFSSITFLACKKNDPYAAVTTDAVVLNSGAPAADGCGWIIRIPVTDSTYSPVNLSNEYKVSELKVRVKYKPLPTKFSCGWGANLREVSIESISKSDQ